MIQIYNWKEDTMPNVLHFQGKAKQHYSELLRQITQNKIVADERITILTCATDESLSKLICQLKENKVPFINYNKPSFYHNWDNTMKITYLCDYLNSSAQDDKVYLILDGYDIGIQTLDGLYDKFINSGKVLLFNSTKHNWPIIDIDKLPERDFVGEFKYFNAGACIGFGFALKKFYNECLQELKNCTYNPWKSEQYIVRKVWAHYSEDKNRIIDFNPECTLFQTFGSTQLVKIGENKYKVI
jgi:hypothetical protein